MSAPKNRTAAPPLVTPMQLLGSLQVPGFNIAALHDSERQQIPPSEVAYSMDVDQGLASTRSKYLARTQAESQAATHKPPPAGLGLSLRMAMPGQAANECFPMTTDRYGKPRK